MPDALEQIEALAKLAGQELTTVKGPADLEAFRIKYLGTKGQIKDLMKLIGTAPVDQKPLIGQRVNAVKQDVTTAFEAKKAELASSGAGSKDGIDVTEPGRPLSIGNRHILMKVVDELVELFGRMGFSVATGPEVEDEFHNFIALNIPKQHPARDPLDNFYLAGSAGSEEQIKLLRTQTSTVQIRVMEQQRPPIRVV
ncbi:MAG TPA: hypothetical protein VLI90_17180, partial [Tepidisphaeraceae bacterium]|nr:hypothetical protein [Tepidisphaeraceae bacterium]